MNWFYIYDLFQFSLFLYAAVMLGSYLLILLLSIGETRSYLNKSSFTDYKKLASSEFAPTLSIIAPAYNEGATIIENVKSLLNIYYNKFEVLVINDGSKDDSLEKLVQAYQLELIDKEVDALISTKPIRGIYRSRNPVYKKLLVVDKVNGGKADALNVGINVANNDYIVCIDVDCILEQDAMLKLTKPFLENNDKRVIATGGVVRIANSCVVKEGKIVQVNLPDQFLPRMQTLEYIRAFLLGRMAWSRLNGLLLISGAFGAFDREIVIKVGGYDHNTVGEDMELVVRMRRFMEEQGLPYEVAYIPDPLCWTEAPTNFRILGRQRNRWTRGTIETLKIHKKMFLNPRYGILGLLSYPYWFFFECLAPLIEFMGMIFLALFICLGMVDWQVFIPLLLFVFSFSIGYSALAILMEVMTYNQYKKRSDILKLMLASCIEPIFFHPFVVWSAVRGNIDLLRKKNSWGEMTRTGFAVQKKK